MRGFDRGRVPGVSLVINRVGNARIASRDRESARAKPKPPEIACFTQAIRKDDETRTAANL